MRINELSSLNATNCVVDEFYIKTKSDDRVRRDIIRRNIRAIDLFPKKTNSLLVH
jgi:hypothetical protein